MATKKKKEEKKTPEKVAKPKGIIEVGVPGEIAKVDKGVKEVFYRGEIRKVMECNTRQRELELQDKDSVGVVDFYGNITTIFLE